MADSFQIYTGKPSATISGGLVTVPLHAVTSLSLSETYEPQSIGSSTLKAAAVAVHDDPISLSGNLIVDERLAWKLALENLAYAPAGQGEQRVGVSPTAELYGAPLNRERTAALVTAVPGQSPQPAVDRVKPPEVIVEALTRRSAPELSHPAVQRTGRRLETLTALITDRLLRHASASEDLALTRAIDSLTTALQDLQRDITTTASDIARLARIDAATPADLRAFARDLRNILRGQ
jgi:hypothetical protein